MFEITIETYAKLSAKGRCTGRVRYTYLVAATTTAEAEAKATRTHHRRAAQGTVPVPPKGRVAAHQGNMAGAAQYVIL